MDSPALLYYGTLVPSMLAAITFHEYAHARVALALGDPTALQQGRVSLNPLAHLDPMGTVLFVLIGFGWGKPVPVNRSLLRYPRADFFVSAAGPVTNLVLAFLAAQLLKIPALWAWLDTAGAAPVAQMAGLMFMQLNVALGLFNLLPIHPLDGSHTVRNLLPEPLGLQFERVNRSYGPIILLLLFASGYVLPVSPIAALLGPAVQFLMARFLGAPLAT